MKKPYDKLNDTDKNSIIESYYTRKDLGFSQLSNLLKVSERAVSRVLKEASINTKRLNRYTLEETYFDDIDCEEKAYILGLIYADGFVGNESFNNIVLGLNDRELVEVVAKILKFTGNVRKTKKGGFKNSKESYVLNFSSTIMAKQLRELGLYPNKSLTVSNLPNIKEELYRHFVRGYFDGDGSIILSKNTSYYTANGKTRKYEYPTYTFMLLGTEEFLVKMLSKINVKHYIFTNTKTKEIKCLRVTAKCEFKYLFDYLYGDSLICLKRKYDKWLEIMSAFMM